MQAGLGCRIAQRTRTAATGLRSDRSDMDDPPALFREMRQHRQRHEERAFQVAVQQRIPFPLGLSQRSGGGDLSGEPGVVHQHVEPLEGVANPGGHRLDSFAAGKIGGHPGHTAQLGGSALQALGITGHQGDPITLLPKAPGDGQADARRAAGDQGGTGDWRMSVHDGLPL